MWQPFGLFIMCDFCFLLVHRQQLHQLFMPSSLHIRYACYDAVQIVTLMDAVGPACGQQRAYYDHAVGCLVVAAEEILLAAQRNKAYGIIFSLLCASV